MDRSPLLGLIVLALAGCSSDIASERAYNPPAEVKIALSAGEKVICEVSSQRFGFPLASPPGASIYFWGKHRYECWIDPALNPPPKPAKPVAPPKPARGAPPG